MPQITPNTLNVDLTRIENAEVRRAVRQLVQQLQEIIARQQIEIDALLEVILDKNISSMSEFRLHVQRISQHAASGRAHPPVAPITKERNTSLEATTREVDTDEHEGRQVYRL